MILRKYEEIMDRVEMTPQMQERILANVSKEVMRRKRHKVLLWRNLAAAACLCLIVGTVIWQQAGKIQSGQQEEQSDEWTQVGNGIIEQADRSALEQTVGFSVEPITQLPFTADHTMYLSYWDTMAEVVYQCGEQQITMRKAVDDGEDISGDYNEYAYVSERKAGSITMLCKGNEAGKYSLVSFTKDSYAYVIYMQPELTEEELDAMLQDIIEDIQD